MSTEILSVLARDVRLHDHIDGKQVRSIRFYEYTVVIEFLDGTRESRLPMSVVTVVRDEVPRPDLRSHVRQRDAFQSPVEVTAGTVLLGGRTVRSVHLWSDGDVSICLDDGTVFRSRLEGGPVPLRSEVTP